MRRAFHRHRAADVDVGGLDLALGEADRRRAGRSSARQSLPAPMPSVSRMKSSPKVHLLKANLMSNAVGSAVFHLGDRFVGEAFGLQGRDVDAGRVGERAVADGIGLDLRDLAFAIAERAQRLGHRAVDDLPVAAAGELLEFHQREIGLDAGGVAIHHKADGAGRRHHRGLRVAVAVGFAELERLVPGGLAHARRCRPAGRRRDRAAPG